MFLFFKWVYLQNKLTCQKKKYFVFKGQLYTKLTKEFYASSKMFVKILIINSINSITKYFFGGGDGTESPRLIARN